MTTSRAAACSLLLAALLCGGCATLDEGQCRTVEWRQLGYQDGLAGRDSTRIAEHEKSCAEYAIAPDHTGWRLGYAEGLGRYCTDTNGYEVGRAGDSYYGVCPSELDREFRPAYEDGAEVAARRDDLERMESRLSELHETLERDAQRAAAYVEEVRRHGDKAPPPPALLGPRERERLSREFDELRYGYRQLQRETEAMDEDLRQRYGARPLAYDQRYRY